MKSFEISVGPEIDSAIIDERTFISYQIFFEMHCGCAIVVGKLGEFSFPAGSYVYTGSAKKRIRGRILRHLSSTKKLRWHIDYLLAPRGTVISRIKLFDKEECEVNKETKGEIIVPGFGATDCKSKCSSHLKLLNRAA